MSLLLVLHQAIRTDPLLPKSVLRVVQYLTERYALHYVVKAPCSHIMQPSNNAPSGVHGPHLIPDKEVLAAAMVGTRRMLGNAARAANPQAVL